MKKFVLFFCLLLASCSFGNKNHPITSQKDINLPAISTWIKSSWILVWVSDSHIYSKTWPKVYSWSYYFDPSNFYVYPLNIAAFKYAYSPTFDKKPVYYYDENDGAQAWMVVYVLRNIYHKKNISLVLNSNIKKKLTYWTYKDIENLIDPPANYFTWWFVWTWKYLVAYNPKLINFNTWDLLLYSSDLGTMKGDYFYKNLTWVNINSFPWDKLVDFDWNLKSKQEISKLLKPLQLSKYKKVYIYYPKYWYRSGILALYLQQNYK